MNIPILLGLLYQLEKLHQHESWSRTKLEKFQQDAVLRLRNHAYKYSNFYQKFHKGFENCSLSELPILTKSMMMDNFDELVTDKKIHLADLRAYVNSENDKKPYLGSYQVNVTSGSMGSPGFFVFNQNEWASVLASFARSHEWAGIKINLAHRMKMASVASTSPWHMSAQVGKTLKSWWLPTLRLAASQPLPEIVQMLNVWQPDLLVAYASIAHILADEQQAGRLQIYPTIVYTSSEVLTAETRRQILNVWGCEPFNQYASTEVGGLAAETIAHQGLVLYDDNFIFEVVDEQYRPVPPGVYGTKILLTVLYNFTQPLIRYELNDSIQLAADQNFDRTPFTRINNIQGRTEDILHFPGKFDHEISVHPLTFHRIMDTVSALGWQIVQEPNALTILIIPGKDDLSDKVLIKAIGDALESLGAQVPPILIHRVGEIPKTSAGKIPLIKAHHS